MNRRHFLKSSGLIAATLSGCIQEGRRNSCADNRDIRIRQIPPNGVPWMMNKRRYISVEVAENLNSVDMYDGGMHPLQTIRTAKKLLSSYLATDEQVYRKSLFAVLEELLSRSGGEDDLMWLDYRFDFDLHGSSSRTMEAPWLSGMAQGIALGLWAHAKDHNISLPGNIDSLRRTLKPRQPDTDRWVTLLDNEDLWIEEYPTQPPAHTLNGKLFAVQGLISDWFRHKNNKSKELAIHAMETVERHMNEFHVEDGVSYYCLDHQVQAKKYHKIHIEQLQGLAAVTRGTNFGEWAARLAAATY